MRTFVDLVQIYTTSAGTGPFALGQAVTGFWGTDSLINGAEYSYSVQDGDNIERGTGTYVASTGTLTRVVKKSTNGNSPVDFGVGVQVCFTFTSDDIADLLAARTTNEATAIAAFNAFGWQWGVWFNATPVANELLALYSCPVAMIFQANFDGAATASPIVTPAGSFILTMDVQRGGEGSWITLGTIELGPDGSVSLATVDNAPVGVSVGDRLRIAAPAAVGELEVVQGFSVTFKGYAPNA